MPAIDEGPWAGRVPGGPAIEIDANGSPVSLGAAQWLVCFVPGLRRQWWHRFANRRHKHVFALRAIGDDGWLLVEPWWTRLMVNVLTHDEALKFLRWGAAGDILKVCEAIPGRGSQLRGWSNCSVLVSFLLGRSYWTWTPNGLYRRLACESDAESVDVPQFLRDHFWRITSRNIDAALRLPLGKRNLRLDDQLSGLGVGIVTAMMSSSAIGLYKAAASEPGQPGGPGGEFWALGPGRVVDRVREILEDANGRGEIGIDDCGVAAGRFVAMLRGDLHAQVVFGMRAPPSQREIRTHVTSAVSVFLRGARRAG